MTAVYDLLTKQNLRPSPSGNDYLIKCLNPEHADSSPSLRVDKTTGMMHCFACGFKGNLFAHYGIRNNFVSIKTALLKKKLQELANATNDTEFPYPTAPFRRSYRSIAADTYIKFGAFVSTSLDDKIMDRVFFPVKNIQGRIVSYIGRCTRGTERKNKYYVFPSGVPMPLYPSIFPKGTGAIVLVEGIFDMLNLQDKGLEQCACVFGVDTLVSTLDEHLMPLKAQNISKIFIMFDGDDAGRKGAYKLKPLIEQKGFFVEIIDLPQGQDPGELSEEDVLSIKEYINGKAE